MLAEYQDIFSLEPRELACTDLAKHEIRVFDDEPFKEQFWRNHPPMVDKGLAYVKEMLEVDAICPSQSPWCNAVVLVCKKDRGLCFCIDFCKLNARTKKDSYLFPQLQEVIKSLVGEIPLLLRPEGGFLANCNGLGIEAVHHFHCGKPRILQMQMYAIWAVQCPSHISQINAELPRGTELDILPNLFGWHDSLLKDGR